MPEKEIIIKVQLFDGEKELNEILFNDLSNDEVRDLAQKFTAELKKREED